MAGQPVGGDRVRARFYRIRTVIVVLQSNIQRDIIGREVKV